MRPEEETIKNISIKLPPSIKDKWVAALRSGDFIQGQGCLRGTDGIKESYCCLGVLAKILNPDQEIPPDDFVYQDAGIEYPKELIYNKDSAEILNMFAVMNDGEGEEAYSFPQIADVIEKWL